MRIVVSLAIGVIGSLIASYAYAGLQTAKLNPLSLALSAVGLTVSTWLVLTFRAGIRLPFLSGIVGYFPKGQSQYQKQLLRDMARAKAMIVCGARGKDLIGEDSPIGQAMRQCGDRCPVEVYLLAPDSKHARLRSGHLDVEREKYRRECELVQNWLTLIRQNDKVSVSLTSYDSRPVLRLFLFDFAAYVAFYAPGIRGRDLPCFRVTSRFGPVYRVLRLYVDSLQPAEPGPTGSTLHTEAARQW